MKHFLPILVFAGSIFAMAEEPTSLPFGFTIPEVYKTDWNTRALCSADMNGDGKLDLLFINNDKARIEILIQSTQELAAQKRAEAPTRNRWEPVLVDCRFIPEYLVTSASMLDMVTGDLNGDGLIDIAMMEQSGELRVYLRTKEGGWAKPVSVRVEDPRNGLETLHILDLDGDGTLELIADAIGALHVFRWGDDNLLHSVARMAHSSKGLLAPRFADLDADGRLDILLNAEDKEYAFRIRRQQQDGKFGAEELVRQQPFAWYPSPWFPGAFSFSAIDRRTRHLQSFSLRLATLPPTTPWADTINIESYAVPVSTRTKRTLFAWGDFDGDGHLDLAVSDDAGARIMLYFQDKSGNLSPAREFPSYADITSLVAGDIDGDGKAELFSASQTETIVGMARYDGKRLSFPEALPVEGIPLALTTHDFSGNGIAELAVVARADKERRLLTASWNADSKELVFSTTLLNLTEVKHDPSELLAMDIDQNGRTDLLIIDPFKPLHIVMQTNTLAFAEATTLNGYSKSLIARTQPGGVGIGDLNGDGKPELLVLRKGFVRALRMDAGGQLEVVDQINASSANVEPTVACWTGSEFWMHDRAANRLERHIRNAEGLFTLDTTASLPEFDVVSSVLVPLPDGTPRAFLYGRGVFWKIQPSTSAWVVDVEASHQTDLPGVQHSLTVHGDFNADGSTDVLAVDNSDSRMMEIFSYDQKTFSSRMHFRMFETDPGFRERNTGREPRQVMVGDFTNDGKHDLAVLVHDRILIIPQE